MGTQELRARLAKCLEITMELQVAMSMTAEKRQVAYGVKGQELLLAKLQVQLEELDEEA